MIRRPPRSTLFPTRRSSDLFVCSVDRRDRLHSSSEIQFPGLECLGRSEEHTSELQSRENLVCRLLLEKKKTRLASLAITGPAPPAIARPAATSTSLQLPPSS